MFKPDPETQVLLAPDLREEVIGFNLKNAGKVCGVSKSSLYQETRLGYVRKTEFGIYPKEALIRWLREEILSQEEQHKRGIVKRKKGKTE